MQTNATLQELAVLDREQIERNIRAMYLARRLGDTEACLTYFAPDAVFEIVSATGSHGFTGRRIGRDGLRKAIQAIDTELELLGTVILDVIIDGDRAAVRKSVKMRGRGTGVTRTVETFDYLKVADGLIVEMEQFMDTATVNVATGKADPLRV